MEPVRCPKCQSEGAWFREERDAIVLHCLCGLNRVVSSKLDSGIVIDRIDSEDDVSFPRFGSKLHAVLVSLVGMEEATTGEITEAVNEVSDSEARQTSSNIASHLTVLRLKGLVETTVDRKGVAGGSTWRPTSIVIRKFKGVER